MRRNVFKEKKLATLERQKKELENLENQWRDGLNILSENTKQDKNDYLVKTKAHQEELRRARLGVKENLKSQLDELCNHIVEEDRMLDEFRERDIDRLKGEVLKMKFKEVC